MPLALVAVDISRAVEVVLDEGPLVEAVLASTAIPGLFPPVPRGDQLLVDGGVLNNVPVDVAQALGASRVIAVDLGMVPEQFAYGRQPSSLTAVWSPRRWVPRSQLLLAERALSIMMAHITERRLTQTPPAILLRPVVESLLPFDFTQTLAGRMVGERAVFAQREALEALRTWRAESSPEER
jgi:NTE family protein